MIMLRDNKYDKHKLLKHNHRSELINTVKQNK